MEKVDIVIVGAGVIGLAIGQELSRQYKDIVIIEKKSSFGEETSSRNSEVIHAGIYYPKDSLKARTCVEGRQLLYEYCRRNNIGYKQTGKLIVALDKHEAVELSELFKNGINNGVDDLKMLTRDEMKKLEPNIEAEAAIYSPSTGILDSHSFMEKLVDEFKSSGAQIAYNSELIAVDKNRDGFEISLQDRSEGQFKFMTKILINCAGLCSDKVAEIAGVKRADYKLKYCKGDYFRVHNNKARFVNRLVYPLPRGSRAGLGIHATLDLAGGMRLGPDDEYIEKIDYNIKESKRNDFYESVSKFMPFIRPEDLSPDTSGVRPKLQGEDEGFRDFIIKEESDNGSPGLINLIGIESPGLTGALSIARIVKGLIK